MSYLRVAGCHKRPSAHHSDLSACNLVLSSPVAVAGRVMTAGSGFEACFCWREGGHCIHCMHCALQFLPDGFVHHALPFEAAFPFKDFRYHVYADMSPVAIDILNIQLCWLQSLSDAVPHALYELRRLNWSFCVG